ncbi:MAG: hypothetical protein ABSF64_34830 [Bryobacteraceae bacterium]
MLPLKLKLKSTVSVQGFPGEVGGVNENTAPVSETPPSPVTP